MNSSLRHAISIAGVLLLHSGAGAYIQDDEGTGGDGSEQILADLGADLRVAIFAEVLPKEEAIAIWETAAEALTSEHWEAEEASESDVGDREAMGILGDGLKDAIASGQMSEEEAAAIWEQMMVDLKHFYMEQESEEGRKLAPGAWQRSLYQSGGMLMTRLRAPDPGRIRTLLRPEFLHRDAAYLRSELQVEKSIATIIEAILEDYIDAYSARVDAFQEALHQSRRRGSLDKVDGVLARMQGVSLDRDRAAERIGIIQNAEKRQRMFDALDNFENNLGKVRNALQAKRAVILENGNVPDRATIHRMFAELKSYRDQQRRMVVENIEAILPPNKSGELQWALHQLRLEQARNESTLGGMDVDLVVAVEKALDGKELDGNTAQLLQESIPLIASSAQTWTNGTIRREGKGLKLATVKLQGDDSRISAASQDYTSTLLSELSVLINLRNVIQSSILKIAASLQANDPTAANRFQQITKEQGFAGQMRQRWCQKALAAALKIEGLDEAIIVELLQIQEDIAPQLDVMREQAIRHRLEEEPRVARGNIQQMRNPDAPQPISVFAIQGPNYAEFNRLDEQVQRQLTAFLSEEQFRSLPRRPGTRLSKEESKDGSDKDGGKGKGKGKGKGEGKAGGKGRGKG